MAWDASLLCHSRLFIYRNSEAMLRNMQGNFAMRVKLLMVALQEYALVEIANLLNEECNSHNVNKSHKKSS